MSNIQHQIAEPIKHVIDGASVGIMGSALMGWLPAAAALLTVIWTCIRIYETKTVQNLLKRFEKVEK